MVVNLGLSCERMIQSISISLVRVGMLPEVQWFAEGLKKRQKDPPAAFMPLI